MLPLVLLVPIALISFSIAEPSMASSNNNNHFVSAWDTTKVRSDDYQRILSRSSIAPTDNRTIKLPLTSRGSYDFQVNWGAPNDNTWHRVTSHTDRDATHTYAEPGVYNVTIKGKIQGFSFNTGIPSQMCDRNSNCVTIIGSGDNWKLINISKWGPLRLHNMNPRGGPMAALEGGFFMGAVNLHYLPDDANLSGVRNMYQMFMNASSFNSDISGWNVSEVWWMDKMFYNASSFDQDISGWDVCLVSNKSHDTKNPGTPDDFATNTNIGWVDSEKPDFKTTCDPNAQVSGQSTPPVSESNSGGSGANSNSGNNNNNGGNNESQESEEDDDNYGRYSASSTSRKTLNSSFLPGSLTYKFKNMSVQQISIKVMDKTIVTPSVTVVDQTISGYDLYESFDFTVDKPEANISKIQVLFGVPKRWMYENEGNSGDIVLLAYNSDTEEWEEETTAEISSYSTVKYLANLPRYTRYAIGFSETRYD